MQNLNLLIIFIKFSFVFGMRPRHPPQQVEGSSSAHLNFPPSLPDNPIVHAIRPIKNLDKRVSTQLKEITKNVDAELLNIIQPPRENISNFTIDYQNKKYLAARDHLNEKLTEIQQNINNLENEPVEPTLTLSSDLTNNKHEKDILTRMENVIKEALWEIHDVVSKFFHSKGRKKFLE